MRSQGRISKGFRGPQGRFQRSQGVPRKCHGALGVGSLKEGVLVGLWDTSEGLMRFQGSSRSQGHFRGFQRVSVDSDIPKTLVTMA